MPTAIPLIVPPGLASLTIPMLPPDQGGMAGQMLMQVAGPAVTVETGSTEANLTPVQLPFVAGANGFMRLTRDPAAPLGSLIGVHDVQAPGFPVTNELHSGFHSVPVGGWLYLPPGPADMGASVKVFTLTWIPAGHASVLFQTGSSDGGDIDLRVYRQNGSSWVTAGSAGNGSPDETVTLNAPVEGWYASRITLYQDDNGVPSTTGTFIVNGT